MKDSSEGANVKSKGCVWKPLLNEAQAKEERDR